MNVGERISFWCPACGRELAQGCRHECAIGLPPYEGNQDVHVYAETHRVSATTAFLELECSRSIERPGRRSPIAYVVLRLLCLICNLVAGCAVGGPNMTPEQAQTTETALRRWEANDLGDTHACWTQYAEGSVSWDELPDQDAIDHVCPGEPSAHKACAHFQHEGVTFYVNAGKGAQYLHDNQAHELGHWLNHCTGRHWDGDPDHLDSAVFPGFEAQLRGELDR